LSKNSTFSDLFFSLHLVSVNLYYIVQVNVELSLCRHEAERLEQEAKGRLERQKISDEAEAERSRKELLKLQANNAAVESTGQAKARAEAAIIEGETAIDQAKLKAQAMKIEAVCWSLIRVIMQTML
jgi:major vault protein